MAVGDAPGRTALAAGLGLLVLGLALVGLGSGVATQVNCDAGTSGAGGCLPLGSYALLAGLGCVGVGLLLAVPAFVRVRRAD